MTAARYCRTITRRAHSSFLLPFALLTPQRRAALYALYAFCREVDDVVDGGLPQGEARRRLQGWRKALDAAFTGGGADHPVTVELRRYQRLFVLPVRPFYDILDGMEMDLAYNRYPTLAALEPYCQRVAGAVGVIAMGIFLHERQEEGEEGGEGHVGGWALLPQNQARYHAFAQHLGMALQLTNMMRDVAEDADMGRIYLPQQFLQEVGVTEADVVSHRWSASLGEALRRLADVAQHHYQAAEATPFSPEEQRRLRPAFWMSAIYRAYLDQLRRMHFHCFGPPVRFSLLHKVWIVGRTWRRVRA